MPTIERLAEAEQIEGRAFARFYTATPAPIAGRLGLQVEEVEGAFALIAPAAPIYILNRVVGLGAAGNAGEEQVDRLIELYRQAGVKLWGIQLNPRTMWLEKTLLERGFKPGDWIVKNYREAGPVPEVSGNLRVEQIGQEKRADFADVFLSAFEIPEALRGWVESMIGIPGWGHYVAYDGNRAISAGGLYYEGPTGFLGFGGTIPAGRRQGGQGQIIARRLEDGIALGCRGFYSEARADTPENPNPSLHNMYRAGFRQAYLRRDFYIRYS